MLARREFLRVVSASTAAPLLAQPKRRPNLVILYADDMGYRDVGFNGRKEWATPNLDRAAAQGTIFDRWYTAYPLCAPSRAALLTGRYGIHNGVRDNQTDLASGETTLAEAVRPAGYATALFGKWHRGRADGPFTHPLDQGFEETFGYLDAIHAWEHFPKKLWRGKQEVPVEGYSCDLLAREASRFIARNRAYPFLLYVPFIEPHFWVEAPAENMAKFRGKFPESDAAKPVNAAYGAMIERLDAAIGRIFDAIRNAGLDEDTMVVFSSDNGATFEQRTYGAPAFHDSNGPFRGQKRSLEEGGIRVPAFVRWPGRVPAGRRSDTPVHMTDVMPTMLAAAGISPGAGWKLDGHNLLEHFAGKAAPPERTLFWEFQVEGYQMKAAMRGDWKYLDIGGNQFFYNLRDDPSERRTRQAEQPALFKSMQEDWERWWRSRT